MINHEVRSLRAANRCFLPTTYSCTYTHYSCWPKPSSQIMKSFHLHLYSTTSPSTMPCWEYSPIQDVVLFQYRLNIPCGTISMNILHTGLILYFITDGDEMDKWIYYLHILFITLYRHSHFTKACILNKHAFDKYAFKTLSMYYFKLLTFWV